MKIKGEKLNIVFMGTPEFSVPSLAALVASDSFQVSLVVTQKDKLIGRKQEPSIPPVKKLALAHNIAVSQPDTINEIESELRELNPDIIVVIAYGNIIPKAILDIAKYGCVNIHGSLLPKYRGAACVQAAIRDRQEKTGITFMKMDQGLDTGDIIKQFEVDIKKEDTAETLFQTLSQLGAETIVKTLEEYVSGDIDPIPQDKNLATYEPMLKKEDAQIDWAKTGEDIKALLRAFTPWPGVYTTINNKKIKILEFGDFKNTDKYQLGKFFVQDKSLYIQASDTAIEIKELQVEGKKKMSADNFIQGYKHLIS